MLVGNFGSVVFILAGSMGNRWEDLSVRSLIASKLVGDELQRWFLLVFQHLVKEALSSSPVSAACDQDIEDVTILIDRSPKIMTFTADGDEQLVDVPDVAHSTLSSPPSSSVRWSKLPTPGSNRFVRYGDASLREKVLDIAKAQREPMVQPDGMADDLRVESGGVDTMNLPVNFRRPPLT